jgi:PAS domain S-box-containing protein
VTSSTRPGTVERQVRLDPIPESARRARAFITGALLEVGRPELDDSATLLVSELVTNAILHARTSIKLTVDATPTGVHVGVNDGSTQLPVRRDYGAQATTGRGLELVDIVATRHGIETHDDGSKTVWFELGVTDDSDPAAADELPAEPGSSELPDDHPADHPVEPHPAEPYPAVLPVVLPVVLRGMPLRLARAWQQHVAALMREYLLLVWELGGEVDRRLAEQALASDALADVAAALDAAPPPDADDHVEVHLQLSSEHARRFEGLDRLLDAVLRMPGRDDMLTPRMQPEMRTLRRWICAEVRGQLAGLAPLAWSGLPEIQPGQVDPSAPAVDWDPSAVQSAELPVLAADDANRIVAASPPALALLGWTAGELLGQRIVTVVPARLREQFIAAFSEYLLRGETAVLDHPVDVLALRRDGSEVHVELVVRQEPAAAGRAVFVATIAATP